MGEYCYEKSCSYLAEHFSLDSWRRHDSMFVTNLPGIFDHDFACQNDGGSSLVSCRLNFVRMAELVVEYRADLYAQCLLL